MTNKRKPNEGGSTTHVSAAAAPPAQEPKLEEQLLRRQSGPRPSAQGALEGMNPLSRELPLPSADWSAMTANNEPIGVEQIREALQTLQKYKAGKANLEKRIIENEQWYKLRHWECMRTQEASSVEPASGWLFNCIANKHADAMDNYPAPNILPREEDDQAEAEMLSSILPVILEQNDFEETYDNVWDYKLKAGTGIYGVFWDAGKLNGLGDIAIRKVDILNLFWESGITDIQSSRNLFHVELKDNDLLIEEYPQLQGKLGSGALTLGQYVYDDSVDTTGKSAVIDWYYKVRSGGQTKLHYCKFVNDVVLFASENEETCQDRGWYDHGQYPFIFDPLFSTEGTPCGFGYIDIGKSAQEYIDRGNQAIMMNMLANAKPRHFIRSDGEVNEKEYADMSKDFVHVGGNLGQDSILPIQGKPLNSIYVQVIKDKVDELKETTGNRDISAGGTTSGVTAASAIAAMQEAGSKLSRDHIKSSYRAFRKVCLLAVELIRQFYDLPRAFRILGQNGTARYVRYSNAGLMPQHQGLVMGMDMGYRLPLFDIEITAQKASPYSKLSQNELALQFFGAGFFNPQLADQALACLEMMDFDRKEFIIQRISQNGTMFQELMLLRQQVLGLTQQVDPASAEQMAQGMLGSMQKPPSQGGSQAGDASHTEALGGREGPSEAASTREARQRVAESTSPG